MKLNTLANGSMLAGVATLAACACGAGSGTVKALASVGMRTKNTVIFGASCGTDHSVQPIFVGVGALLILIGMSIRSLSSAVLAAIGCFGIAAGHFMAGPSTMSSTLLPHTDTHLWGYGAYVVGAIFLIAAFMRVFRSPKPFAAGTAMVGMAAATGCSCCMVTGALTGLIASAGMPGIYGQSYVFFAGAALITFSLWKLGGFKPAILAMTGAAMTYGGPKVFAWAVPDLIIRGASFKFIPGYAIYFVGAATMMASFVVAYRLAEQLSGERVTMPSLSEPLHANQA